MDNVKKSNQIVTYYVIYSGKHPYETGRNGISSLDLLCGPHRGGKLWSEQLNPTHVNPRPLVNSRALALRSIKTVQIQITAYNSTFKKKYSLQIYPLSQI